MPGLDHSIVTFEPYSRLTVISPWGRATLVLIIANEASWRGGLKMDEFHLFLLFLLLFLDYSS